jgi:2-methylcitrate dehydratase PrpD
MRYTDIIVDFTLNAKFSDFPDRAKDQARMGMFDAIGCAIAGSQQPAGKIGAKWARGCQSAPTATVWGNDFKAAPHDAALVNGTAGHALDYDDVIWSLAGHPSVVLNAALYGLGEATNASGEDVLLCYMIGVEIMAKIGLTTQPLHSLEGGWHPTSTVGTIGASMACSRMLGLSKEATTNALGMAGSMSSGNVGNFATMTKPFHAGMAARNGIEATQWTSLGFTATKDAFDGKRSFHNVYSRDLPAKMEALEELGKTYELDRTGMLIKPYPCGVASHPAIDAALLLYHENGVRPDDVEKIEIGVTEYTYDKLNVTVVGDELQGKFSIAYPVARALADGEVLLAKFGGEHVNDPDVQRLVGITEMYVDKEIEKNWKMGTNRPCRTVVTLKKGERHEQLVKKSKGDPANPLTREELRDKFRDCMKLCFDDAKIEEIITTLEGVDQLDQISEITGLLAKN